MVCYNCTPTNCNCFNSCCQMMQRNELHLLIGLCWNLKKIHNGCSVSCGQTRLIFNCIEQLAHTTIESGQERTHMNTQRNLCTHYILLFGVILTWKLLWVPFKSLVQDQAERHVQSIESVTQKCYKIVIPCLFEHYVFKNSIVSRKLSVVVMTDIQKGCASIVVCWQTSAAFK